MEEEEDHGYHVVKCGLSSLIHPNGGITKERIERWVQQTSKITYWAYKFLHYYLLRQMERDEPFDFEDESKIAGKLSQAWGMLSGHEKRVLKGNKNPAMLAAFDQFRKFAPTSAELPRTGAVKIACGYMRIEFLTTMKNLVMTTFESRQKMWCRLQLVKLFFEYRHAPPFAMLLTKGWCKIATLAGHMTDLIMMDQKDVTYCQDRIKSIDKFISKMVPYNRREKVKKESI